MLSFHGKFVETDRQMDRQTTVKQYAPDLSIRGHKNIPADELCGDEFKDKYKLPSNHVTEPCVMTSSHDVIN